MRYLKKILLILTATIIGIAITNQVNAANNFHQPKNTVYQVTYINAGAYQTRHQFAIFNSQGHVIYIDVEDIDESGTPIVDDQATTTQRRAPSFSIVISIIARLAIARLSRRALSFAPISTSVSRTT